jgi:hypothetical protein
MHPLLEQSHVQLWSRTNKPKHYCRCSCSTRCEYLQLPTLPLWPQVQYLFNPCVHWQNICPQRQSWHPQTQTTHWSSRASKGTTVVTKESEMWDQQNVCTGWWYMHQQAFRSPLHCGSLHWSRRVKHYSIIPRHAHCNQCYRWVCPWVLHADGWASWCEKPLCSLFCLENLMRSLGLEMARWTVVSAPRWRGLYLGHTFLNRTLWQQKNYKLYILRWRILYAEGKPS